MYQSFLNTLSSLQYCGGNHGQSAYQVGNAFKGAMPELIKTLLDDDSGSTLVEDAQLFLLSQVHFFTREFEQLGSGEAGRLLAMHEQAILSHCQPNFVDPGWVITLSDLGAVGVANHLAGYTDLTKVFDSGVFEDIERLGRETQNTLARAGLKSVFQGYTFEFLDFAAGVALCGGYQSPQGQEFMSKARASTREHYAKAMINAIAAHHATVDPVDLKQAVRAVWGLANQFGQGPQEVGEFKLMLTDYYRELEVPMRIYAQDNVERERILSQDLGL